jgi:ribosomal protein S18 acetylase RimI-like enzyme
VTPTITLRPARAADADFVFEVKRDAMEPYSDPLWRWDDGVQRDLFRLEFEPARVQIIQVEGTDAGVLVVDTHEHEIWLSEIYLQTRFRNRGIGTVVITRLLAEAEAKHLPVFLEVHKHNPARRLYERLGFHRIESDDTHDRMMHSHH